MTPPAPDADRLGAAALAALCSWRHHAPLVHPAECRAGGCGECRATAGRVIAAWQDAAPDAPRLAGAFAARLRTTLAESAAVLGDAAMVLEDQGQATAAVIMREAAACTARLAEPGAGDLAALRPAAEAAAGFLELAAARMAMGGRPIAGGLARLAETRLRAALTGTPAAVPPAPLRIERDT